MALVNLVFLSILVASFGLVIAMTRPSAQEKRIEQLMALNPPIGEERGALRHPGERSLKATRRGRFGSLEGILPRSCGRARSTRRILQASSSTNEGTLILTILTLFPPDIPCVAFAPLGCSTLPAAAHLSGGLTVFFSSDRAESEPSMQHWLIH